MLSWPSRSEMSNGEKLSSINSEARLFILEVMELVSRQTVGSPKAAAAFVVALCDYPVAVLECTSRQLYLPDSQGLPLKDYWGG